MKRLLFAALTLLTYYLAAMYRYPPLMALCGIELITAAVSVVLARRFCCALRPAFPQKGGAAQAETKFSCVIRIAYAGKLPTGRFHIRMRTEYPEEKRRTVFQLSDRCGHGGRDLEFQLMPPYCGLLYIRLERLRAYDYFSLFSFQKRLAEEMRVAVFPKPYAVQIDLSAWEGAGGQPAGEGTVSKPGDAHHEIRQIREYRAGDSTRHIHWNLSARTEQLWLKEYERETDSTVNLILDMAAEPNIEERSAFYTLVSALTLGLLNNAAAVRLYWFDMEKHVWETALTDGAASCRDALFRLYQAGVFKAEPPDSSPPCGENAFRLDLSLTWYFGDTRLYQFSSETLEQDIRERSFVL